MEIRKFDTYEDMKRTHGKEFDAFPLGVAFSDAQFKEAMAKWGYSENDTDKIYSIGGGAFIRREDSEKLHELMERFEAEENEFKKDFDKLVDMIVYQMRDYEYGYTHDPEPTLSACGYELEDVENNKDNIKSAWAIAKQKYLKLSENY